MWIIVLQHGCIAQGAVRDIQALGRLCSNLMEVSPE